MNNNDNPQFELGAWVGRRQAFSLIASRCSAADVECLRKIRDEKLYKSLNMSWEEFCAKHAGMTRRYADQVIRQLEELGPGFFRLSEVVRIAPETYRLISGAVKDEGPRISRRDDRDRAGKHREDPGGGGSAAGENDPGGAVAAVPGAQAPSDRRQR